jgi:hypothetical protein
MSTTNPYEETFTVKELIQELQGSIQYGSNITENSDVIETTQMWLDYFSDIQLEELKSKIQEEQDYRIKAMKTTLLHNVLDSLKDCMTHDSLYQEEDARAIANIYRKMETIITKYDQ